MKQADIIVKEKNRADSEKNIIYLNKEGNFYHAYEYSAYLIKNFVCTEEFQKQRGDDTILSANRYQTKTSDYVMIGFPLDTLNKFIPEYITITGQSDFLSVYSKLPDNLTLNDLFNGSRTWKESLPAVERKSGIKNITSEGPSPITKTGIFSILSEIISYPVESKTPAQNMEFISKLKQKIISLL